MRLGHEGAWTSLLPAPLIPAVTPCLLLIVTKSKIQNPPEYVLQVTDK